MILLAIATSATATVLPLTTRDRTRATRLGGEVEGPAHDVIAAAQLGRRA